MIQNHAWATRYTTKKVTENTKTGTNVVAEMEMRAAPRGWLCGNGQNPKTVQIPA